VPGNLKATSIHKNVRGVLTIGSLAVVQYVGESTELPEYGTPFTRGWEREPGISTLMSIRYSNKGGILLNLSDFSERELDALKDFINASIEKARPSAQERDAIAREAEARGDYPFARSNRADPKLVGDPRKVG
jgi:hypothetical protein